MLEITVKYNDKADAGMDDFICVKHNRRHHLFTSYSDASKFLGVCVNDLVYTDDEQDQADMMAATVAGNA